jgi:hypothetical protein
MGPLTRDLSANVNLQEQGAWCHHSQKVLQPAESMTMRECSGGFGIEVFRISTSVDVNTRNTGFPPEATLRRG